MPTKHILGTWIVTPSCYQNYLNDSNQLLHNDKDCKYSLLVVPKCATQIQNGGSHHLEKKWTTVISQQLFDQFWRSIHYMVCFPCKNMSFRGQVNTAAYLCGHIPNNPILELWTGILKPNAQLLKLLHYQNHFSNSNQILRNDENLEVLFIGVSKMCPTNPRWRTSWNRWKSLYLSNRLPDYDNLHDTMCFHRRMCLFGVALRVDTTPQLHQHLRLHSTCHLNNKTYPLTPNLLWHQYDLHLCILYWLLDSRNLYKRLHHFVHATLYITTFPVYSVLTTSTLYWIITTGY